ncbi:ribonuclease P protein component [Novosphingobium profundi]|uniref:ribonuclease P protein component n=1 Tax=Novosphingobium profundi TaxID=1774954 RepID=UPI001CFDB03E|nr:ribonuclease P protein component [Novosphingobium profundi]
MTQIPYQILSQRSDFLAANKGTRVARAGFVLLANRNAGKGVRAGITVTKRIGNAVVRNRMKRRFRALLRELLPEHGLPDTDHVLIGREDGIERDFALLREELVAALGRARDGKGDPPRGPRRGKRPPRKHSSAERGKGQAKGGQAGSSVPEPVAP